MWHASNPCNFSIDVLKHTEESTRKSIINKNFHLLWLLPPRYSIPEAVCKGGVLLLVRSEQVVCKHLKKTNARQRERESRQ